MRFRHSVPATRGRARPKGVFHLGFVDVFDYYTNRCSCWRVTSNKTFRNSTCISPRRCARSAHTTGPATGRPRDTRARPPRYKTRAAWTRTSRTRTYGSRAGWRSSPKSRPRSTIGEISATSRVGDHERLSTRPGRGAIQRRSRVGQSREGTRPERARGRSEIRDRRDRRRPRRLRRPGRDRRERLLPEFQQRETRLQRPMRPAHRRTDRDAVNAEMDRDLQAHDPRTTPRRRLDALAGLCRLALDHGDLGEIHGVRPHVSAVFDVHDSPTSPPT